LLGAGLGALILLWYHADHDVFGYGALSALVQCTSKTPVEQRRYCVSGLIACWPSSGSNTDIVGALLMIMAGFGWAAYTRRPYRA
jgi:hypothetical protein